MPLELALSYMKCIQNTTLQLGKLLMYIFIRAVVFPKLIPYLVLVLSNFTIFLPPHFGASFPHFNGSFSAHSCIFVACCSFLYSQLYSYHTKGRMFPCCRSLPYDLADFCLQKNAASCFLDRESRKVPKR